MIEERLFSIFTRLKEHCIAEFVLQGTLGSRAYALKPNMAPIRFGVDNRLIPLPLLGLHKTGFMSLETAVSHGQIVAVFVGSEGYIDSIDAEFDIDFANIEKPDFLWLEIVSRQYRHYEAYLIKRTEGEPELEVIPNDKINPGESFYTEIFKLHS